MLTFSIHIFSWSIAIIRPLTEQEQPRLDYGYEDYDVYDKICPPLELNAIEVRVNKSRQISQKKTRVDKW
jgi:hypothetical protein